MKVNKATIGIFILILLIAGAVIYSKSTGLATQNIIPSEEVAKWIGNHSVMYSQTGCIHCKEQLDLFGDNAKYLNIIDEKDMQKFIDAGITATPTWIINGQKYVGKKTIEELKELTGYKA